MVGSIEDTCANTPLTIGLCHDPLRRANLDSCAHSLIVFGYSFFVFATLLVSSNYITYSHLTHKRSRLRALPPQPTTSPPPVPPYTRSLHS